MSHDPMESPAASPDTSLVLPAAEGKPALAAGSSPPIYASWERLTVLDFVLLMTSCAVSFAIIPPALRLVSPQPVGAALVSVLTLVLSPLIAGPIILVSHWGYRQRRTRLGPGEIVGGIQAAGVAVGYTIFAQTQSCSCSNAPSNALGDILLTLVIAAGWLGQPVLWFFAARILVRLLRKRIPRPLCFWTNLVGALHAVAAGGLLMIVTFVGTLQIHVRH